METSLTLKSERYLSMIMFYLYQERLSNLQQQKSPIEGKIGKHILVFKTPILISH